MESLQGLFSAEKVVYGTSDHLLNFGEVLLTCWVAEARGARPIFFNYPKGPEWAAWEESLFEPYGPPSSDPYRDLVEAGLPRIEVFPLQAILPHGDPLEALTLGKVAEGLIRPWRGNEHQAFVVLTTPRGERVRVSSKDRTYTREFAHRTLWSLLHDPSVKLGGSIIYFLYGHFLARNSGYVGILPGKQSADVLGAFQAGRAQAGGGGRIVHTGEFDFMTARQWEMWEVDGKWRKAPLWAIWRLLESPFAEVVRSRLLVGEYCPLAYDEKADRFFFWEV